MFAFCLTERQETKKARRRKVFCQIAHHLLENHEMWKRLIAAETREEAQEEKPNCIGNPTDPITAIREEEEEQASKEEEESADDLDEREEVPAAEEEEILPQSEPSGEKEEEPKWDYEL